MYLKLSYNFLQPIESTNFVLSSQPGQIRTSFKNVVPKILYNLLQPIESTDVLSCQPDQIHTSFKTVVLKVPYNLLQPIQSKTSPFIST